MTKVSEKISKSEIQVLDNALKVLRNLIQKYNAEMYVVEAHKKIQFKIKTLDEFEYVKKCKEEMDTALTTDLHKTRYTDSDGKLCYYVELNIR